MRLNVSWGKTLAGVILGVIVVAAATEIGVRVWAPQELTSDLWTFDGPICHRLKPNTSGHQRSREFRIGFDVSSQGFRDRDYDALRDVRTKRILFLGDSHTFGFGVEQDETYSKVLERALNDRPSAWRYEVINGGTMGYGTGHQYQQLERIGWALQPDLVVLSVNLLHDIAINNELFLVQGDSIERNTRPCRPAQSYRRVRFVPFHSFLRGHSHAFRFGGLVLRRRGSAEDDDAPKAPKPRNYDLGTTEQIVRLTKRSLDDRGIDLAVVVLSVAPLRNRQGNGTPDHVARLERDVLDAFQAFLADVDIPYFSFDDAFRVTAPPDGITFEQSAHYNSRGHRYIANAIERFLLEDGRIRGH